MKNLKFTTIAIGFGIFYVGGGIKAQVVGDWPDATGASSGIKTYTIGNALGVGTQFPKAWTEILYCPHVTPSIGMAISSTDICQNQGNSGGPNLDGIGDPNGTLPPFEMQGTVSNVPISYPPGTGYHSFYSGSTGPLFVARTQSPTTALGSTGIMGAETTRFIINPDGKIGINTANPRAYVDAIGGTNVNEPIAMFGVKIQQKGLKTVGPMQLQEYYTRHIAFYPKVTAGFGNSLTQSNDQVLLFTDGMQPNGLNLNGGLVIAPHSNLTGTGGLRMDNEGNIELRGNLRTTKVTVNAKWWPDFVFGEQYKLMKLDSLAYYLQQNRHLPGIPSDNEIIENGQDLGDIQILQQQKIEELFLYIISLKEEIDLLKCKVYENAGK